MDNKDLLFVKLSQNDDQINTVYEIIKSCGQDMYENQGLLHWKDPYPIENIKKDCIVREVYLAFKGNTPVATFMLSKNKKGIMLSKLAVSPECSGQGIGSECLEFAEKRCIEQSIYNLHFDVCTQSKSAINFYLKNGYEIYGEAPTRHFRVLLMEKNLK
ncbi:MAG: GNAT family N-acetyltransferase [Oscillospiraceae bacterium]|nr:GNAT family N-acetyltransferase [Oscillospiraceae bacterium]